jgi:hypothetical protein
MVAFVSVHFRQVIHSQAEAEARHFPERAVAYLRAHPPVGPIFNHYDWGGYLIWKLYPQTLVFLDGRADLYGEEFLNEFARTYQLKDDWHQTLDRWHVETVIVPADSRLAQGLLVSPGWALSYRDSQAVVMRARR